MINKFTYDEQFPRTIPACMIDGRKGNPSVSGQIGDRIRAVYLTEIQKAKEPGVIPYKMETINGNLIGFLSLKVQNDSATVYQLWLREAFKGNLTVIQQDISSFITGRDWVFDALL